MPGHRFIVYTRQDCPLCDDFVAELSPIVAEFEVRDVDDDPTARRRFGLKVPVLTCDGSVVCHGRLDAGAVGRLVSRDRTLPAR
jgi:glutaredoxin